MPIISIIVPVYNVEKYLRRCLDSVLAQTFADYECILVDDGSSDNCPGICDEYAKKDNRFKVIHKKQNEGLPMARKSGLNNAAGEFVVHLDSDDWIEPDMYEKMYKKAVEEDADIVCCGFYEEHVNKKIKNLYPFTKKADKELLKEMEWNNPLYSAFWNKLIKKELYVNNNIYPYNKINVWEDVVTITRLRYVSKKTVIMYEALYHYNKINTFSITSTFSISKIEEQIRCAKYIEKFFIEQSAQEEYFMLVQNMKFTSKEKFLFNKSLQDIKKWKAIFPETHKYIWKYNIPLNICILYLLVIKGLPSIACILIDLKLNIKRIIKMKS